MRFIRSLILGFALLLGCVGLAAAQSVPSPSAATCHNSGFLEGRAITDLCWDCFFPIRIVGIPIGWGSRGMNKLPDDTAFPICVCPGRLGWPSIGITMGYWSPEHLIETVRTPWCSPMLGMQLVPDEVAPAGVGAFGDIMARAQLGGSSGAQPGGVAGSSEGAMFNMHWILFPGGKLVNMLMDIACAPKSIFDIDYGYLSEIDPTFHSDVLALYTAPESHVFTQMYAHAACIADGVAATVRKPILGLFWCAGTWGMVYPMDGHPSRETGFDAQASVAARGLSHVHRFGLAKLTYGDMAVCQNAFWFVLPHQQYQFQNFWPMPTRTNAYWLGTSHWWGAWGLGRRLPVVGEDRLIMEWDYRECCLTFW